MASHAVTSVGRSLFGSIEEFSSGGDRMDCADMHALMGQFGPKRSRDRVLSGFGCAISSVLRQGNLTDTARTDEDMRVRGVDRAVSYHGHGRANTANCAVKISLKKLSHHLICGIQYGGDQPRAGIGEQDIQSPKFVDCSFHEPVYVVIPVDVAHQRYGSAPQFSYPLRQVDQPGFPPGSHHDVHSRPGAGDCRGGSDAGTGSSHDDDPVA